MKFLLRKCPNCGRYTFKDTCPTCNTRTYSPHPPRFSPQDKYVRYRALAREESLSRPADTPRS
ncbi:MAG: RNA-protein complex protein Nop10 [Zestosphaera sp.]